MASNHTLEEVNLGIINGRSLVYLADFLVKLQNVKYLSIEECMSYFVLFLSQF